MLEILFLISSTASVMVRSAGMDYRGEGGGGRGEGGRIML